jgi:cobaltochelatase CobS
MATEQPLSLDEFKGLLRDTEVACKVCGYKAHSLIRHLADEHKLSAGQYRNKFPREAHADAKLISPLALEFLRRMPRTAFDVEEDLGAVSARLNLSAAVSDNTFSELSKLLPLLDPKLVAHFEVPKLNPHFKFPAESTEGLVLGIATGKNTYISGPSGCGKTVMVEQLHARMGRPLLRANMNGDMTAAKFIGSMRVKTGIGTYYQHGMLPQAMKAGITLLLDEVDYTPPQIATVLNPVLEGGRRIYLEEADEVIHAAPGFCIVATGNTSGKGDSNANYTGTEILNTAFLDRFGVKLNATYLPADQEVDLLLRSAKGALSPEETRAVVKFANMVREAFMAGQLSVTLTTRKLLDFADFRAAKVDPKRAMGFAVFNWLDKDDLQVVSQMADRAAPKVFR